MGLNWTDCDQIIHEKTYIEKERDKYLSKNKNFLCVNSTLKQLGLGKIPNESHFPVNG